MAYDLCNVCQSISLTGLGSWKGITHRSVKCLRAEATKSQPCPLCSAMLSSLDYWRRTNMDRLPIRLLLPPYPGRFSHMWLVVASEHEFKERVWLGSSSTFSELQIGPPDQFRVPISKLRICAVLGTSAVGACTTNLPESSSGSENCFQLASQWIEACSRYHDCMKAEDSVLPKRVIDVGSAGGSPPRLKTQPTIGEPERGKYIALSYCWGKTSFLTLTPSNFNDLEISMSMDSLPRTVQDAIIIVRKLGLRFLWVDALCILQGPSCEARSEWGIESPKMAKVYQRAYFTLSAALSTGAHEGILRERATDGTLCRLPYRDGLVAICRPSWYPDLNYHEPLEDRGWTYQEDILSQRVLKYGSTQMSWRCPQARWTECHWNPTDAGLEQSVIANKIPRDWREIVEKYSPRKLTVTSDRLPAIAGLADFFQSQEPNDVCWIIG